MDIYKLVSVGKTISLLAPRHRHHRRSRGGPQGRSRVSSRNLPSIIHWPINNTGIAAELFYLVIALHTMKYSFVYVDGCRNEYFMFKMHSVL